MKEQGVLLLALGAKNYGKMSAALAAMLKAADSSVQIHLAYTDSAIKGLSEAELQLFDSRSIVPERYYTWKGQVKYIAAKMYLYNLSPFQKTLFLDSDIAWMKKPVSELLNSLNDVLLTYSNFGDEHPTIWANWEEVREVYQLPQDRRLFNVHSELVYFQKSKPVAAYFKAAQAVYKNIKVQHAVFAGAIPDELPFAIASAQCELYPHIADWHPIAWHRINNRTQPIYEMAKTHYGISMAGNFNPADSVKNYDILAQAAYYKSGLKNPYQWQQKQLFLSERQIY